MKQKHQGEFFLFHNKCSELVYKHVSQSQYPYKLISHPKDKAIKWWNKLSIQP